MKTRRDYALDAFFVGVLLGGVLILLIGGFFGCGPQNQPPASATVTSTAAPTATATPATCCKGDADKNGVVNNADYTAVQANFGTAVTGQKCDDFGCMPFGLGDADCNSFVNNDDFAAIVLQIGAKPSDIACHCLGFGPNDLPLCQ